jgi:hypothetical protein
MTAIALIIGFVLGVDVCAAIAGWIWLWKTDGNDQPLTNEEIKERVAETWGGR